MNVSLLRSEFRVTFIYGLGRTIFHFLGKCATNYGRNMYFTVNKWHL